MSHGFNNLANFQYDIGRAFEEGIAQQLREKEDREAPGVWNRMLQQVKSFEAQLDNQSVLGIAFSDGRNMVPRQIGFDGPILIVFDGITTDGHPARVVQHISRLDMMFLAVKVTPQIPKRPIGFQYHPQS